MIYIVVALKAEAQAFVDKFKLKNFKNENLSLSISGIGVENMTNATCKIVSNMKNNDIILNVGICGASKNYAIGQLIDAREKTLTCVDYEVKENKFDIVDMESLGFIQATKDIKNSYIFKIVSDHFEPHKVTKDKAKKLIFQNIDEIMKEIKI